MINQVQDNRRYTAFSLAAIIIYLGMVNSSIVNAAEPSLIDILSAPKPSFHFNFENDFITGTDANYTTGFRIGVTNTAKDNNGLIKRFKGQGIHGKDYKIRAGMHFANNIYTGQDIDLAADEVPADDRPYAGWTYLGFTKTRLYEDDSASHYEFDIGCIGPCAQSDDIQKTIHSRIGSSEPRGWSNQIADDLAIQLFYTRSLPIAYVVESKKPFQRLFDISPSLHAELGTIFNSVGIGANIRFSLSAMKSYFDGIGISPVSPEVTRSALAANYHGIEALGGDIKILERFLYFRTKARYMLYNATIEGSLFNEDSPFTQDIKDVVVDMELGVMLEFKRFNLNLFIATKSTEVAAQASSLTRHKWGGLNIAYQF